MANEIIIGYVVLLPWTNGGKVFKLEFKGSYEYFDDADSAASYFGGDIYMQMNTGNLVRYIY